MRLKSFMLCFVIALCISVFAQFPVPVPTVAASTQTIALPAPSTSGGMPLVAALHDRRSVRAFTTTPLTQQEISQLLWAAQGITDDKGHRTAPSARGQYFLKVYAVTPQGFYEYVPQGHKLQRIADKDIRSDISNGQSAVAKAPFVIAIVFDESRTGARTQWAYLEAGHAAQNVLLQATALNLGAVPVGGYDETAVRNALHLPAGLKPAYLIPIGHPQK